MLDDFPSQKARASTGGPSFECVELFLFLKKILCERSLVTADIYYYITRISKR